MNLKTKKLKLIFPKLKLHKGEHTVSAVRLACFLIVFVGIGAYVLISSFADSAQPIVNLQAEKMSLPTGAVIVHAVGDSNGEHVRFDSAGAASAQVTIPQNDTVQTVSMRMDARTCGNRGYPTVALSVDGKQILPVTTLSDTNWNTYQYNLNLGSGTYPVSLTTSNDQYYNIRCIKALKVDNIVFNGTANAATAPTLAFSSSPSSISSGSSATLSWSSTNASSCQASGSWTGNEATSGNTSTGALNATSTYNLECTGTGGTVSQSVTVTVAGGTGTSPSPSAAEAPIAYMSENSGQQNYLGNTSVYKYIILQNYMAADNPNLIPSIHKANPNTKVLMYADGAFIYKSDSCPDQYGTNIPAPVDTCDVNSAGQAANWYLGGSPITAPDYPQYAFANIASSTYENEWITNASATAKALGFDGIFMDDVNTTIGHEETSLPGYSTDEAYGQAMDAYFKVIAAGIHKNGLIIVPNISDNPTVPAEESLAEDMAPSADAVFQEFFENWGASTPELFTGSQWLATLNEEINVGKTSNFYANTYSDTLNNPQIMAYARATFLLGWNGNADSAFQYHDIGSDTDSVNMYNSTWAASVGSPTDSYSQTSSGIYQRNFTDGTVLVNSSTSTETMSLGGTYTNTADNSQVSSVTLAPESAVILQSD